MRKKKAERKVTGLLLSLMLAAGILTGCGASAEGSTEASDTDIVIEEDAELSAETGQAEDRESAGEPQQKDDSEAADTADAQAADDGQETEEDPTLGGIFELYTPEEYAEVVENIKQQGAGTEEDIKSMEADLERLRADGGKGEFIIYKGAFEVSYETGDGGSVVEAVNPDIIMRPDQMDNAPTAGEYEEIIKEMDAALDEAVAEGRLTQGQKDKILEKMNQNLSKLP